MPAQGPVARNAAGIAALYFLSGATGLSYEVLWSRMLSFQFGVSIFGVAVTVAGFMLGLGCGSLASAGVPERMQAPRALRWFAVLEAAIAVYALALPGLNALGGPLLDAWCAQLSRGQWLALQSGCALALLALPAAAMGAAFPLVLRAVPDSETRLARIYGLNCLGAALGAVLSLALLAALGWGFALQVVASIGLLVAAGAWTLARSADRACPAPLAGAAASASLSAQAPATAGGADPGAAVAARQRDAGPGRSALWRASLAYAGVGACGLVLEVAWTRLYGMVLLRTEYVLAVILAVYLLGTALGSLLAARWQRHAWPASAIPLAACGCTLVGAWLLPELSAWVQAQSFRSLASALAWQALALALFTLPTTAALGAWLPVLARRLHEQAIPPRRAAVLYGANCLGAAAGAVGVVAVGIPRLGTMATICLAAFALLVLGVGLGTAASRRWLLLALAPAAAAAWLLREFPEPQRMLPASAQLGAERYRYEDALTLNDVVQSPGGQRTLLTDLQHMDASSEPAAVQIQSDQARLPLLLHRDPRSILFLGLGTGISAAGSLPYPDLQRVAVEISPGAIEAARNWFAPVNGGVAASMRLEQDDARHYLASHAQRYDVVVGDLFHPDLAGMAPLLSVEQFRRARSHLNPGGIFAQWLALNQFDSESLHTVLRGFRQVFPDGALFLDGMHLALVGSDAPQSFGANVAAHLARWPAERIEAQTGGEGPWTWLARYCGGIGGGVGPAQSETRPLIEYRLPQLRYEQQAPLAGLLRELLRQRPTVEAAAAQLGIPQERRTAYGDAYLGAELVMQSWIADLDGEPARSRERTRLAFEVNPREHWVASALADELYEAAARDGRLQDRPTLEHILQVFPAHVEALRALWHLDRDAGSATARSDLQRLRALAPLDREIAAATAPVAAIP